MSSVDWGGASGRANKTWGAERDRARERERENMRMIIMDREYRRRPICRLAEPPELHICLGD